MSFYFLPSLKKGDKIYFDILGKNLEYEVTDSEIIDEYEGEKLKPIENEDMVTLMTCMNEPRYDKRLLVNAKRVVSDSEKKQNVSTNPLIPFVSNQHIKLGFQITKACPLFDCDCRNSNLSLFQQTAMEYHKKTLIHQCFFSLL